MRTRVLIACVLLMLALMVDAWLIANPNWLGKLGFWIYKYHYLKTFPKALLTVTAVTLSLTLMCSIVYLAVRKRWVKRRFGKYVLYGFAFLIVVLLVNVTITFSRGTYGHTGTGFRIGANLLPCLLLFVVGYFLYEIRLLRKTNELNVELPEKVDVNK